MTERIAVKRNAGLLCLYQVNAQLDMVSYLIMSSFKRTFVHFSLKCNILKEIFTCRIFASKLKRKTHIGSRKWVKKPESMCTQVMKKKPNWCWCQQRIMNSLESVQVQQLDFQGLRAFHVCVPT